MQQIIYNRTLNLFYGSASGSNGKWFPVFHTGVRFIDNQKQLELILDRNSEYNLIAIEASMGMNNEYISLCIEPSFNLNLIIEHCNIYNLKMEVSKEVKFKNRHIYITSYSGCRL